nr:hypothetical protein [Sinorhizobium fredii]
MSDRGASVSRRLKAISASSKRPRPNRAPQEMQRQVDMLQGIGPSAKIWAERDRHHCPLETTIALGADRAIAVKSLVEIISYLSVKPDWRMTFAGLKLRGKTDTFGRLATNYTFAADISD